MMRVKGLGVFCQYFKERYPEDFSKIIAKIPDYTIHHNDTQNVIRELNIESELGENKELLIKMIASYLNFINYGNYKNLGTEFEILIYDYVRGFLFPGSIFLKAVASVFGRNKGIKIYQDYIDYVTTTFCQYSKKENVNEFLFNEGKIDPVFVGSFDAIQFETDDGRVGVKILKCKWAKVLSELNDPEFAYTLACHYDFCACKCSNPNFELTRTQVLTQEKEYCDFVWHDRRINSKLEHLDKEFWNDIEMHESLKPSPEKIELTPEQKEFHRHCMDTYNSGNMKTAFELALLSYEQDKNNLFYKYMYAVLCGDYSFDKKLETHEQQELLAIAKKLLKEVFEDKEMSRYSDNLVSSIKNEYYFFNQLFEDQYNLGKERVANGQGHGTYSMCVGAAELAKKRIDEKNISEAQSWAKKSLDAFLEFEKISPTWYNINIFAATALIILGRDQDAILTYKDLYRKQGSPINEKEMKDFAEEMAILVEKRDSIALD